MTKKNTIRAWRDPRYRMSLSDDEKAALPAHPAGIADLSDEELTQVSGGFLSVTFCPTTVLTSCCNEGTCP